MAVHETGDGVLARRHIKEMFWQGKTDSAMQMRLSTLYHAGYLNWPNQEQRKTKPIPEPIVWLGWKGALWIAGQNGIEVKQPASENENQMRKLERELRRNSVRWRREMKWNQLSHDLAVIDTRLAFERASLLHPNLMLEQWLNESVFRSDPDVVTYKLKAKDGSLKKAKRGIIPDSSFVIVDEMRRARGEPARARCLLEHDAASHAGPKFARVKIAAGAAYIKSPAYRDRFGDNAGRWLVVTTTETRMNNLMVQASTVGSEASLFFFTTLETLCAADPLTSPIWWKSGADGPVPLIRQG
jgi:hypothetical protein